MFLPLKKKTRYRDRIEEFIDENKALMRRMYGDFRSTQFREPPQATRRKRDAKHEFENFPGVPDITAAFNEKLNLYPNDDDAVVGGDSYFGQLRHKRQAKTNKPNRERGSSLPNASPNPSTEPASGR